MDKAVDPATADVNADESAAPQAVAAAFGNDDLGRLQSILLGDHARQTVDRIDTLEQALLGALDDLRGEMRDRVKELEGRIAGEADTRGTALANATSRIDDEAATRAAAVVALGGRIDAEQSDQTRAIKKLTKQAEQETNKRESLAADVKSGIKDEAAARTAALTALTSRVDDEATGRDQAVTGLAARVDSESEARAAALAAVGARVDEEAAERASDLEVLNARIDNESSDQASALKDLNKRVDGEAASRASAMTDLAADVRATENDLNQAIESTEGTLADQIAQLRAAADELTQTNAELGAAKVDRASLAALLGAVAAGLEGSADADAVTDADEDQADND